MEQLKAARASQFSEQLGRIFGLPRIVEIDLRFNWQDGYVKADVTFIPNEKQVRQILTLMEDGSWMEVTNGNRN